MDIGKAQKISSSDNYKFGDLDKRYVNRFLRIILSTFLIAALGLTGFITSIESVIKGKDRAILNFLPILVGLIIIFWISAEIMYPH